jgi:hypothetical protein
VAWELNPQDVIRVLNSLLIFLLPVICAAQSFNTAAIVLEVQPGIELYRTKVGYHSAVARPADTTIRSSAGNGHFALAMEVGITRRIGITGRLRSVRFFGDVDDVIRDRMYATSADYLLGVNWHPVVRNMFDLAVGVDAGLSTITFRNKSNSDMQFTSSGAFSSLSLQPRFYLGRWGFSVRTWLPLLYFHNVAEKGVSEGDYSIERWFGNGAAFSVGLQVKLL